LFSFWLANVALTVVWIEMAAKLISLHPGFL
jgi:hypothetical protein